VIDQDEWKAIALKALDDQAVSYSIHSPGQRFIRQKEGSKGIRKE